MSRSPPDTSLEIDEVRVFYDVQCVLDRVSLRGTPRLFLPRRVQV